MEHCEKPELPEKGMTYPLQSIGIELGLSSGGFDDEC
jgi:hypothetical protein